MGSRILLWGFSPFFCKVDPNPYFTIFILEIILKAT